MTKLDELIAEAELGEEARNFVESDLGKTLIGMAEQETMAAQIALETVLPTDTEQIRRLQNKAMLGRYFRQWLIELIDKGQSALEVYKNES